MKGLVLAALLAVSAVPAAAQPSARATATVQKIVTTSAFRKAVASFEAGHERWVEDVITLAEIPAPPFKEAARAVAYRDMFAARGLSDVEIDEEGNVLGLLKGKGGGKLVIVSAHLDTVFPEGTDVKVRREGDKLFGPGVGDDSAGLAMQLALIDAIKASGIRTRDDILFVGTVGEEGLGDLRGVRHLMTKGRYAGKAKAFFSIDGGGLDSVVIGGAGSRRYRVTFKGPGGHSYGAFGIVNPMVAMGQAITDLYKVQVPNQPKTTFSASVVGGGTSVNAIPEGVWLEVDMRSESPAELAKLEASFLDVVRQSVESENASRSTASGRISADPKLIGDRPAGQTPESADIAQFAAAAYKLQGIDLDFAFASTDANLPISLGIPSLTISRSSSGGGAHSPGEWLGIEKAGNVRVKTIGLAMILATASSE